MEFEYISDSNFQEILRRDFAELQRCQEAKATKSTLVLSGSILEAILTDYFSENLPAGHTEESLQKLGLAALLDLAEMCALISKSDKNLATVLKDYRNIIHPGREIRKSETFDHGTAELAIGILQHLLKKIESKYRQKYDLSADDILFNLDEDWNYSSIYSLVITKLNASQKKKLFDEFLDIETHYKEHFEYFEHSEDVKTELVYPNIDNVKEYVLQLKPLLPPEVMSAYLEDLKRHVKSGEAIEALSLYNLVHEEVIQMSPQDQELVATYLIDIYAKSNYLKDAKSYYFDKTFSTIGKYFHTDKGFEAITDAINQCFVNFNAKYENYEFDTFEQLVNSLTDPNRTKVLLFVNETVNKYRADVDFFNFGSEAQKRGLIKFESK